MSQRRRHLAPAGLFLLLCAVYVPTIARDVISMDVFGAHWTSWHLVVHGTPWIDGASIPELESDGTKSVLIVTGPNGHEAWGRFPGVVALSLPAYAIAHLTSSSAMSLVPGSVTAAVVCAGAAVLMFLALRRAAGSRTAWVATLALALATPMWSVSANGVWPHTVTALGIAGMAWAAGSDRWYSLGFFGGVAMWGRLHVAIVVVAVVLLVAWARRRPDVVARAALTGGLMAAGYCVWMRWVYGGWDPLGAYDTGESVVDRSAAYRLDLVNQAGTWIAPDRGVLVWTPVLALLLPALVRSWRSLPDWSRALCLGGVAYTVVNSAMMTFTGGDAFYGYRYGLELVVCCTPALALSFPRAGAVARHLIGPVVGVQVLAISFGAVWDRFLPQELAWHANAFVDAVGSAGPGGWAVVALAALEGWLVARFLARGARETTATSADLRTPSASPAPA